MKNLNEISLKSKVANHIGKNTVKLDSVKFTLFKT